MIFSTERRKALVDSLVGIGLPLSTSAPIKLAFFCDSSSHRDNHYMVAGGLALQTKRYAEVSATIQKIKDAARISSEMKWSAYKGGERSFAYRAMVDLFFSLVNSGGAHFHSLIAEFGKFSHAYFDGGTPETSVNRMFFQLLVHRVCRNYAHRCLLYVYPDQGNDSADLLHHIGNINYLANKIYSVPHNLQNVEARDSSRCNVLQLVDIIIGGMAYQCNDRGSGKGKPGHKAELSAYILEKVGRKTWLIDTPFRARKLTVWNFRHRQMKKVPQSARRNYAPRLARPAYSRFERPSDE